MKGGFGVMKVHTTVEGGSDATDKSMILKLKGQKYHEIAIKRHRKISTIFEVKENQAPAIFKITFQKISGLVPYVEMCARLTSIPKPTTSKNRKRIAFLNRIHLPVPKTNYTKDHPILDLFVPADVQQIVSRRKNKELRLAHTKTLSQKSRCIAQLRLMY
eukprot:TRINITY_DN6702_c0_g1_i1.p1 TRINITY_DN6702_c0_g1~~TRINITY_DN6702_c0_g1_i1.p1  ORF type:complete len:160 (-),score=22.36 TRINITY_DN6702_c0_g1_i1:354-833(-)